MPYQLIYSSTATGAVTQADLETVLAQARAGNAALEVTGLLVFVDGVFLQVLEGERDTVLAVMAKIERDPRHCDVHLVSQTEIERRAFASWRMAYAAPSAKDLAAWVGLEGATTVRATLDALQAEPARASALVINLLGSLA